MLRVPLLIGIVLGAAAFLLASVALARVLAAKSAERSTVVELIEAQARGDSAAVVAAVAGCAADPRCRVRTGSIVRRLRRAGTVQILRFDPSSGLALRGGEGEARVAWRAGPALPVVQCVTVSRDGSLLRGFHVRLRALSRPIALEGSC